MLSFTSYKYHGMVCVYVCIFLFVCLFIYHVPNILPVSPMQLVAILAWDLTFYTIHSKSCFVICGFPWPCNKIYIGETGRTCLSHKNVGSVKRKHLKHTHVQRKSTILNHCKRENHIIDWVRAKIIRPENNKFLHWNQETCPGYTICSFQWQYTVQSVLHWLWIVWGDAIISRGKKEYQKAVQRQMHNK